MSLMTAAEAAVRVLESEGVAYIFGIPGAGINPLYAALSQHKTIRHIIARHEEGAIHMADGYARAAGSVGVCACTSGPGGTNFVTGLYTAQADSIPLVAITGQHLRSFEGKEGFQAVAIAEIARPVCKKTFYVREPGQVPWVFREAFRTAREGRPGPVLVDLPLDVQLGEIDYDPAIDGPLPWSRPEPDLRRIHRAVEMVLSAARPVILMGGGVLLSGGCDELKALAEYLQLPVVHTGMAKGGFPFSHPLFAGGVGTQASQPVGNRAFLDSDLVLAVGARFGDRHTGTLDVYRQGRRFIQIDVDPCQLSRVFPVDLGIVSDARLALAALLESAKTQTAQRLPDQRVRGLAELKAVLRRRTDFDEVPIKPQRVYQEINEFFDPHDTVFVTSIGLNQIWSGQLQEIEEPGHYFLPGGAGPLGWDLPAALGIKLAKPEQTVVSIAGDYGFGFCIEELAALVQYGVPVLMIVVNNGNMGLIRQNQQYVYRVRHEVDLWYGEDNLPDYVKVAEAYGAYSERVSEPAAIKPALARALEQGLAKGIPALVEIVVERNADCAMGTAIDAVREFEPAHSQA